MTTILGDEGNSPLKICPKLCSVVSPSKIQSQLHPLCPKRCRLAFFYDRNVKKANFWPIFLTNFFGRNVSNRNFRIFWKNLGIWSKNWPKMFKNWPKCSKIGQNVQILSASFKTSGKTQQNFQFGPKIGQNVDILSASFKRPGKIWPKIGQKCWNIGQNVQILSASFKRPGKIWPKIGQK